MDTNLCSFLQSFFRSLQFWRWSRLSRFGTCRRPPRRLGPRGRCQWRASRSVLSAIMSMTTSSRLPRCWTAHTPSAWSASRVSWPSLRQIRAATTPLTTSPAPSVAKPRWCPRRGPQLWPRAKRSSASSLTTSSTRSPCGWKVRSCATKAATMAWAQRVPRPCASALTLEQPRPRTCPLSHLGTSSGRIIPGIGGGSCSSLFW